MKNVAIILADGFEEIEAISILDILRRANINTTLIGLEALYVRGTHQLKVEVDMEFNKVNFDKYDMIVLPGGLLGAEYLAKSQKLQKVLKDFDTKGKFIGAICAAPWALSTSGVLKNNYTSYPGFEKVVGRDGYISNLDVVVDKNIITSRGPATAMKFALEIVRILEGDAKYTEIKNGLLF